MAISYDPAEVLAKFARLPHPGTFLVNRDGVVRAKLAEEGYRTHHTTDALLDAARSLK